MRTPTRLEYVKKVLTRLGGSLGISPVEAAGG